MHPGDRQHVLRRGRGAAHRHEDDAGAIGADLVERGVVEVPAGALGREHDDVLGVDVAHDPAQVAHGAELDRLEHVEHTEAHGAHRNIAASV